MTTRLASAISKRLALAEIPWTAPARVGSLSAVRGQFLEVAGFPYPLNTATELRSEDGRAIAGEVIGFRGNRSIVQPLEPVGPIANGAAVYACGRRDIVQVGDALLGRVIDAMGEPIDGLARLSCASRSELNSKSRNPLNRGRVTRVIDTGVRAINGLLTIGEGQRVAIIAGSGVGKSVLMGQILHGIDADVIVVGLIGERAREVTDFVESKITDDIRPKTVVVAVAADQVPLLRLRAAAHASTIAEYFASQGKRVLLLIDSLTRVAHAQREIGLALGEPPTLKGYTPSALALVPQLVERAGVDKLSGGSVTAIYTVLADSGDLDDPIVDAARAIVDGHIILSRSMAESGIFPAVDIARSLSRLMPDIVDAPHLAAAAHFRQLWSACEQSRDLIMMGAYAAGSDPVLDEAITRHRDMLDLICQPLDDVVDYSSARHDLIQGFER
jgi:flagellum-specific ATP synthase